MKFILHNLKKQYLCHVGILLGDSGYAQLRYLYTPVTEGCIPQRPELPPQHPHYILETFAYTEQMREVSEHVYGIIGLIEVRRILWNGNDDVYLQFLAIIHSCLSLYE